MVLKNRNLTIITAIFATSLLTAACSSDKGSDDESGDSTNTVDEAGFKSAGSKFLGMIGNGRKASFESSNKRRDFAGVSSGFAMLAAFERGLTGSDDVGADDGRSASKPLALSTCPSIDGGLAGLSTSSGSGPSDDNEQDGDHSKFPDPSTQSPGPYPTNIPEDPQLDDGRSPNLNEDPADDRSGSDAKAGFNVTTGSSCGDALGELHAKYAEVLKGLEGQVNALVNLDPESLESQCGLKAVRADVNKGKAAIAWRVTPVSGEKAAMEFWGGANGSVVTVGSSFEGAVDAQGQGSMSMGGIAMTFGGSSVAAGDLNAGTLRTTTKGNFTQKMGDSGAGAMAMAQIFESAAEISGLIDGQQLKIAEKVSFDMSIDQGGQKQRSNGAFAMTIEELSKNKLKVTGTFDAGPGARGQFEMTLAKDRFGSCSVTEVRQQPAN